MTALLSNADRSKLEGIIAIIAAGLKLRTAVDRDLLAASIQTIPDQGDDEFSALLSNAEHGVSDLHNEGEEIEDNAAYAIECIARVLEYRPRRKAA